MLSKENKICVVGWYYFPDFYKYLADNFLENVYIIAHRYNKILDKLNFNYSIIKNIGLEQGAYDWYIKNAWDNKSNILFMHDDTKISNKKVINKIFKKCKEVEYAYILTKSRGKEQGKSYRCIYLSSRVIGLLLKEFNGIWYDKYNRGYIVGEREWYDKSYTKKYIKQSYGVGKQLKRTLLYLRDKYKFTSKYDRFFINEIYLCVRGSKKKCDHNHLIDNSIFYRKGDGMLENITSKTKDKRNRKYHYYTKWYDFYFDKIKLDNLNVLEIGINKEKDLEIWKKYFKNSTIYGVSTTNINSKNIFYSKNLSQEELNKICEKVEYGFDIIIENGENCDNRVNIFKFLFDKLNNWGMYVLESLHQNYNVNKDIINFLKNRIDDINCSGKFETNNIENNIKEKSLKKYEVEISAINFHSGICFVNKRFLGIRDNG